MKSDNKYVKAYGAHISDAEAGKVGRSIELLFDKLGRPPSVAEFSEAVRSVRNPAHPVVMKKFVELKKNAWRMASEYCLRSVDIIVVNEAGVSSAHKAIFLLDFKQEGGEKKDAERYTIVTREMARNSPEALDAYERQFRSMVRAALIDFSDVAGKERTLKVVMEELNRQ